MALSDILGQSIYIFDWLFTMPLKLISRTPPTSWDLMDTLVIQLQTLRTITNDHLVGLSTIGRLMAIFEDDRFMLSWWINFTKVESFMSKWLGLHKSTIDSKLLLVYKISSFTLMHTLSGSKDYYCNYSHRSLSVEDLSDGK